MRRALLAIALCVGLSACGSSAPSQPTQSPKAQLAAILAKVRTQRSVHYETRSSLGYTITADVGRTSGIEHFVFPYGAQGFHLTMLLVDGVAYVRGDARGLGALGLLQPGRASRYANRWIAIPPKDPRYLTATQGVAFESFVRSIAPPADARITSRETTIQPYQSARLSGTAVIEIGLISKARRQVMEVPPSSNLPIAALYGTTSGGQGSTLISGWNAPVHVKAPANAIPIATIEP